MNAAISEICEAVRRGFTVSCEPYSGGIGIRLFKQDERSERPDLGEGHGKHCEIDAEALEMALIKMPLDDATQ